MTGVAGAADIEAWDQSGVVRSKTWLSALDERVRGNEAGDVFNHLPPAHGETVGLREMFVNTGEALAHPGDPNGSAANIINCRCTQIAAVE